MQEGTIIRLSYDMWLEDHDGLFDTTDRDRASESGIYDPKHSYTPITTVIGAGRLVPGLERALKETDKVGEETTVELAPEEAYGARDPKRIETVPMQRLKQAKITPRVGERIRYKDQPATITRVSGGRVWIDTNSPLAGRKVTYKFKIEGIVEDTTEKARAILEMGYRSGQDFTFEVDEAAKRVDITVPDEAKYDQRFIIAKFRIAHDIGRYTELEKVRFIEEFTTEHVHNAAGETVATTDLDDDERAATEKSGAPAADGEGATEGDAKTAETEAPARG